MKKIYNTLLKFLVVISFALVTKDSLSQNVWYIRRVPPEPWTWCPILNTNILDMDNAFGAGIWNSGYYTTVDPDAVFVPSTCFVFLEGGDDHAIPFNTFVTANITAMENWVFNGGNLLLNAAPNYGSSIDCGFGGVTIVYPQYTSNASGDIPLHPIFNGPFTPVGLNWSGPYFGHSVVSGPGLTTLISDDASGDAVCAELTWGAGKVIFGGMTTTGWHTPYIESANLLKNIFKYLASYVLLDFSYPDSIYCQSDPDPAPIFAAGADTGVFVATPAGLVIDSITGIIDLSASSPGVYDVENKADGFSCASGSSTVSITIGETPVANAGPDMSLCNGDTIQLAGSGGVTYAWTPPVYLDDPTLATPSVQAPLTNMYYSMIAYSALGCVDTDDVVVTLYPDPVIDAGEDQTMLLGGFAQLDASGGVSYVWSPSELLSDALISNPFAYPEDTTMFYVIGTDANGCDGLDSVTIYVVDFNGIATPNAFTPNGDGLNDVYRPSFIGQGAITAFTIYDRWGKLLFEGTDGTTGWDGTFNGYNQEVGTYIVNIHAINALGQDVVKNATLILIR